MPKQEHTDDQHRRAVLRDWLIGSHERVLSDLYCPDSEYRALALTTLATAGWDEHEYIAVLLALQEGTADAAQEG